MIQEMTDVTWESLRRLKVLGWLWLDMVGSGLHMAGTLPETRPAQLSHLWGWGPESLFRVRADRGLAGGFVGASVTRAALGRVNETIMWPEGIGRVGDQTAALRGSLRLTSYEVPVKSSWTSGTGITWLTFYERADV
jgi:hypothetical protein